jgi:hypothetical protein
MLNKAMKRILNLHMATITLLAGVLMASASDKPRTLKSVDKPLDKIQGTVSGARKLSAAELAAARKALLIAAPSLSEVLENLAKEAKGLEKATGDLADKVKEDHNAQPDKAKDLLTQQRKLNARVAQMQQSLRRDANQQDLAQEQGRERARDADDAVAMLKKPPRDAANALEESTANPKPEDQQQSLETAAKAQKQLAANLSQLAEHYKNLEEGRLETADTREALRAQEDALGIKKALDELYGAIELFEELSRKPLDERIKALEEMLKDNPEMQEELQNIAETTIQEAKTDLDIEAQERKQQIAQNAKSGQQKAGNQKGANEALAKDSVEAYMWAYVARQQARKTPGQRANAVRANIHLKRIKKELSAAEIKKAESEAKAILSKL